MYIVKVLSFINKKGGAGKSTTAVGVAFGLQRRGLRVGFIDTDPNGSASRWLATVADMDTVPCTPTELPALLDGVRDLYDVVVVDSPPNDEGAIAAIAAVSSLVVIPMAPTPIEIDQLPDTIALLSPSTNWIVVPARVRMSTTAGREIRAMCARYDVTATRSVVPLSEAVAQSFGGTPPHLSFVGLVEELLAHAETPAPVEVTA